MHRPGGLTRIVGANVGGDLRLLSGCWAYDIRWRMERRLKWLRHRAVLWLKMIGWRAGIRLSAP